MSVSIAVRALLRKSVRLFAVIALFASSAATIVQLSNAPAQAQVGSTWSVVKSFPPAPQNLTSGILEKVLTRDRTQLRA